MPLSPVRLSAALSLLAGLAALPLLAAEPDVVIADFEGPDYGAWQVEGEAFGPGPARGTLPNQMPVSGFLGQGLVNSFFKGDDTTGTLTSPEFRINRRYLSFLIGGGHHPGRASIDLLVNGQVVRTATGPNRQSGGTERLDPHFWDVGDLAGKAARIRIVDQVQGGWGHINIDHLVLTDRRPTSLFADQSREIVARRRYLHLPVKNGAPKRRMRVDVDGRTAREFEIEIVDSEPDFWVFLDLQPFQGKTLTLRLEQVPESFRGLHSVSQSDEPPGGGTLYREALRPQLHFTSRRGWLNDPNGLVYLDGEWHLFYQHNPYGWEWGNMHWGHAVSRDLFHWQELPIALYPRSYGDWAFSGSAVVDRQNTSGFRTGKEELLVAAYTSTGRGECIVYSTDRGRTWTEYAGNPVVRHAGRDPRLLWHQPSRQWVMAVYDETDNSQNISFYTSPNLKEWSFQSRIDGFFECPELFELPVEGRPGERRWVLYGADGQYVLGDFDGRRFRPEPGRHQLWYGSFYASQIYSNAPDGRVIQVGWSRGVSHPRMPFNQQMNLPVELKLVRTPRGPRLQAEPVRELRRLHQPGAVQRWAGVAVQESTRLGSIQGDLLDFTAELEPGDASEVTLDLGGVRIRYDARKQELSCAGVTAPAPLAAGRLRLRAIVDRASTEIFAEGGRVVLATGATLSADPVFTVSAAGGRALLRSAAVRPLRATRP
ncbi:MAG: GH32 C-terminal domain-containing protein [Armatimonadota bacterium]